MEVMDATRAVTVGDHVLKPAPQIKVDEMEHYVQQVFDAIGYSEAWVSDQSAISDFPLTEDDCSAATLNLGVPVFLNDLLVDVAQRLRDKAPEQ